MVKSEMNFASKIILYSRISLIAIFAIMLYEGSDFAVYIALMIPITFPIEILFSFLVDEFIHLGNIVFMEHEFQLLFDEAQTVIIPVESIRSVDMTIKGSADKSFLNRLTIVDLKKSKGVGNYIVIKEKAGKERKIEFKIKDDQTLHLLKTHLQKFQYPNYQITERRG